MAVACLRCLLELAAFCHTGELQTSLRNHGGCTIGVERGNPRVGRRERGARSSRPVCALRSSRGVGSCAPQTSRQGV